MTIPQDTKTSKYRKKFRQLYDEIDSQGWRSHWKEIAEFTSPRSGRYLYGTSNYNQHNDGRKKNSKIFNGSVRDAVRVTAAGLQGGLTSPSRPWIAFKAEDEALTEFAPVREWLHEVRNRILSVFARSNFYGSTHSLYREDVIFGTASMLIEEDFQTVIRCRPFTIGEFMLSIDSNYRPNTLYRQFAMRAHQMVEKFGEKNVSDSVKQSVKTGSDETQYEVVHAIQPSEKIDPEKNDYRNMKFESVYYQPDNDPDKLLRRAGYQGQPFVAPRWDVLGVDTYGESPAMIALDDVKMLQKQEKKKLKAIDKMVDPPLGAPTHMDGKVVSQVSGEVTFYDVNQGAQGIVPIHQPNVNLQHLVTDIDTVERRIRRFFYNDLFLAVLNEQKTMTATEVAKRYEEKLMMLGPVIERLQAEFLDVVIDRTFDIMWNLGLIPPPPKELLEGSRIKVEYISMLAQAQKMIGTESVERFMNFAGMVGQIHPPALDKVDFDESLDQYGDALGVAPKIVRSDDKVAEIRQQKEQQMQMQQMMENAPGLAKAAKDATGAAAEGANMNALQPA